jgi:DNA-directed RNA polymerase specialized sigma24 family protein
MSIQGASTGPGRSEDGTDYARLMAAARHGDPQAITCLTELASLRAYRIALRACGDYRTAEEVVRECALRVLQAVAQPRPEPSFPSLVATTVLRVITHARPRR